MGLDNPVHIAFLLILLLVVFGAKRLPEMGRSLGSGLRGFRDALSADTHTMTAPASAVASDAVPAPAALVAAPAAPASAEAATLVVVPHADAAAPVTATGAGSHGPVAAA